MIEPEIKLVFLVLFVLMVLGGQANSQAVLPAFVLGLVMSRHDQRHRLEQQRLRVVAFAFLTPFFFLRGGMNVNLGSVFANLGLLVLLAAAELVPKLGLVWPLARRHVPRHATFTTLLMSTGLTFGTISLSAIVPTAIAQRWFSPDIEEEVELDSAKALDCTLSICRAVATLTALAVEGQAPRLRRVARRGRRSQSRERPVLQPRARASQGHGIRARPHDRDRTHPGHAAEVIAHYAPARGHSSATIYSAPPPTASRTTPTAQ